MTTKQLLHSAINAKRYKGQIPRIRKLWGKLCAEEKQGWWVRLLSYLRTLYK